MPDAPRTSGGIGAIVAAVIAGALLVGIGFFIGRDSAAHVPADFSLTEDGLPTSDALTPVMTAWRLLEEHYVSATTTEAVTPDEKIWGMISGLAASYGDDYTQFFPPEEKKIFESLVEGNFGGIGIEIGVKAGQLVVVAPLKDTPAYRAGLKSGDAIIEIEGVSTRDIGVDEAVQKIRGEIGTTVTLTIVRDGGSSFEVPLVRATIYLPNLETEFRDDGVFIIRLFNFNALSADNFRTALREFAGSGSDKMIIDLRGNPGGYLEVAVDMASWFLPVGLPVVIQESDGDASNGNDLTFRSYGYDAFNENLKLVVLIDKGSASAAEILAGALRAHDKATLIGEQSFGKGSVQQVFDVTSDTTIKITVAQWLTPDHISISHEGITPDIEVEFTDEDREAERDPQVDRAVEFLFTGK